MSNIYTIQYTNTLKLMRESLAAADLYRFIPKIPFHAIHSQGNKNENEREAAKQQQNWNLVWWDEMSRKGEEKKTL